ncbi:hypothetical protein BDN72DRAFT_896347 [Pluteus cervinus]|uniref:Uncharacterized protein n=1 Tax=Pluteus cervinus TaxID=181527 RepID=A0ACD3AXU7_9AGAR|nr:hypothetical protein BDN72DRAFT_896347 [Pluteus cervinus]
MSALLLAFIVALISASLALPVGNSLEVVSAQQARLALSTRVIVSAIVVPFVFFVGPVATVWILQWWNARHVREDPPATLPLPMTSLGVPVAAYFGPGRDRAGR